MGAGAGFILQVVLTELTSGSSQLITDHASTVTESSFICRVDASTTVMFVLGTDSLAGTMAKAAPTRARIGCWLGTFRIKIGGSVNRMMELQHDRGPL